MSSREHQRNCDEENYEDILDTPAYNTRNKKPITMTVQVNKRHQQLLNTLLDENLKSNTKQTLQSEINIGSLNANSNNINKILR